MNLMGGSPKSGKSRILQYLYQVVYMGFIFPSVRIDRFHVISHAKGMILFLSQPAESQQLYLTDIPFQLSYNELRHPPYMICCIIHIRDDGQTQHNRDSAG